MEYKVITIPEDFNSSPSFDQKQEDILNKLDNERWTHYNSVMITLPPIGSSDPMRQVTLYLRRPKAETGL